MRLVFEDSHLLDIIYEVCSIIRVLLLAAHEIPVPLREDESLGV